MKSQDETERELWRQTRVKYSDHPHMSPKWAFKELLQLYRCIMSFDAFNPEEPEIQQIIREAESRNHDNIEAQIFEMNDRLLKYYKDQGIIFDYLGDLFGYYGDADDADEIIASVDSTDKKRTWFQGPKDTFSAGGYMFCLDIAGHFPKNTPESTSNSHKKKRDK